LTRWRARHRFHWVRDWNRPLPRHRAQRECDCLDSPASSPSRRHLGGRCLLLTALAIQVVEEFLGRATRHLCILETDPTVTAQHIDKETLENPHLPVHLHASRAHGGEWKLTREQATASPLGEDEDRVKGVCTSKSRCTIGFKNVPARISSSLKASQQ